ncbi:hypothetical protein F5890DRAFT_1617382 [Lentinula detonsa]|uniref:Rhamnogalacturonan lyase domain-containing protein n=1 Tax=Lentinula detonsa TaxID=2804962 RepID=A0AA38PTG7_9AGAR|nr:hypothetical protein F5890DRAFT_1617382 [Lentinula detonsa]
MRGIFNQSYDGSVSIPRVKEGWYRLTVDATGIISTSNNIISPFHFLNRYFWGIYIIVNAGEVTSVSAKWDAESAVLKLWHIGIPDKTAGEFRNGYGRDLTHPSRQTQEYRIYWGAWDYPSQFPNGVNFTIGSSNESVDWNYIHWSRFGPTFIRNETVTGTWSSVVRIFNDLTQFRWGTPDINEWQIHFELDEAPSENSIAMFTMQLAGVETTAGTIKSCWSTITFPQRPASMRWLVAYSDSTGDLYQ